MNDDQKYWYCVRLAYLCAVEGGFAPTAAWKIVYHVVGPMNAQAIANFTQLLDAVAAAYSIPLPLV